MGKKVLTFWFAVVLLFTFFPAMAFAEDSGTTTNSNQTSEEKVGNVKGFKSMSTYNGVVLSWKKVNDANNGYVITWKSGSKKGTVQVPKKTTVEKYIKLPQNVRNSKVNFTIVAKNGKAKSAKSATCEGSAVRTMHWKITFNTTRKLKSHTGKKTTRTFKKGTTVDAYGYSGGRYIFDYKGETYYVKRISTTNAKVKQSDYNRKYTQKEAEDFVNRKNLKSRTKNLIWVNTYTQRIYIFKKSGSKWKMVKGGWKVSTGKPRTPTPTGMNRIRSKTYSSSGFQCKYWSVCSEYSIHGKASYYPAMGKPASNGCVRNETANARWIFNNVRVGSAVYVF